MAGKKSGSSASLMDLLAFIAVLVGGIALFVIFVLGRFDIHVGVLGWISAIANFLGWIVLCILSAKYIRTQGKVWMWILWAIALVFIILGSFPF